MMAYLLPHCLILHVPKTGSNWVRAACQASVFGRIREIGPWHCDLQTAQTELAGDLPLVATFVRSPLAWYRSAWLFWRETGRYPRVREEPKVQSRNFEQFVRNCMAAEPRGYVSTLYERYAGSSPGEVACIGKQESLADDLVRLLELAGERFDEAALRATPRRNVGGAEQQVESRVGKTRGRAMTPEAGSVHEPSAPNRSGSSRIRFPGYSHQLACDVILHEQSAMKRFGYAT